MPRMVNKAQKLQLDACFDQIEYEHRCMVYECMKYIVSMLFESVLYMYACTYVLHVRKDYAGECAEKKRKNGGVNTELGVNLCQPCLQVRDLRADHVAKRAREQKPTTAV